MSKNYFTDEQVREMVKKSEILFEHRNKSYMDKLKAIMNLAVETAIGEEVAWVGEGDIPTLEKTRAEYWKKNGWECTPLYSVKELEN